jgi:single-stranded DNA-binding protein
MNSCAFTGYLVDDPIISDVDGVTLAEVVIVVYTYRKTKNGEKNRIPTFLHCEAWHTGAQTLEKYASKGTKLSFFASAKNISKDDTRVIFRINEFEFCDEENTYD